MARSSKDVRVGIYLCDCDGKISKSIDLEKIKSVIQSKADFEYIRLSNAICGRIEREKLAEEIDKYALNRLLFAGCRDQFIKRQILQVTEEKGITSYNVEFVDLSSVPKSDEEAIALINKALTKLQLREEIKVEEIDVTPDVLVIGCGQEAAIAAAAIAKNQPVVMVAGDPEVNDGVPLVKGLPNVAVREKAQIVGLEGFAGNFTVQLFENGQVSKQKFGAIVVAVEARPVYVKEKYGGIEIGDHVLTLSQFLESKKGFAGQRITFVLGKADADSLLSYAKTIEAAIKLKEEGAAEVNILYDDMKVSADEIEQKYEVARAKGVNFLKYVGDLEFYSTVVAATVKFREPFISQLDPIRVTSDYLVLAEDYVPSPVTKSLADVLEIRLGPDGFFQDDNVHFLPAKSNREGIYFVGSCHGPIYGIDVSREAAIVAAEVGRFASGKVRVPALQPRVDAEKCAVCLTCYRTCPHKAIEIVHDESLNNMYHSAARMNPLACRRCGTCAAECPGKAIQLPVYSDQEILQETEKPPKIVAYACENSGYLAAEYIKELEPDLQESVQIVRVPCSGKIDVIYLLKALERGAEGVMLFVCHKENCKFVWGNERAEKRQGLVRKLLKDIGWEEERIEFVHVAANQGKQFVQAVRTMAEKIQKLGKMQGR